MKTFPKPASVLRREIEMLASCKTDEERQQTQVAMDNLWQQSVQIARLDAEAARLARKANRLS